MKNVNTILYRMSCPTDLPGLVFNSDQVSSLKNKNPYLHFLSVANMNSKDDWDGLSHYGMPCIIKTILPNFNFILSVFLDANIDEKDYVINNAAIPTGGCLKTYYITVNHGSSNSEVVVVSVNINSGDVFVLSDFRSHYFTSKEATAMSFEARVAVILVPVLSQVDDIADGASVPAVRCYSNDKGLVKKLIPYGLDETFLNIWQDNFLLYTEY